MDIHTFYVDDWLVETRLGKITRRGRSLRLEPQVMRVLAYLASQQGEVVTKEQLIQAIWGSSAVSDAALTRCVFEIRQAFDDDPKNPTCIETIPKIGLRMIATVRPLRPSRSLPPLRYLDWPE